MRLSKCAWMLLWAVAAWPQQEPVQPAAEEPETSRSEYRGPAILSRGWSAITGSVAEQLRLRPFVSVQGIYDTGLTAVTVTPSGEIPQHGYYGVSAFFGVSGFHRARRTLVGLEYRGSLRQYSRNTSHDGFDSILTLNVAHRATSRVTVLAACAAASYSRSFFLPGVDSAFYSSELTDLAGEGFFDARTNAVIGSGRVVYQASARTSFSLGGSGFTARRHSQALVGVQGYQAGGDAVYRLSRYQTIGVDYSFRHYEYRNYFGATDAHGAALNYATQMGRHWTFGLRAGGYFVDVSRLQRVPVDPVVAVIIGQSMAISTLYKQFYVPHIEGNLTRQFRRATFRLAYTRGLSAGNEIYMTSSSEHATAAYTYHGWRRWSGMVSVSAFTRRALVQDIGRYRGYRGTAGVSHRLGHGLSLTAHVGARRYEMHSSGFSRVSYSLAAGLAFSPGEIPLSVW